VDKGSADPTKVLTLSASIDWNKYSNPTSFTPDYDILGVCIRCPYTDQLVICSSNLLFYAQPKTFNDSTDGIGRIILPGYTSISEVNNITTPFVMLDATVLPKISTYPVGEYNIAISPTQLHQLGSITLLPGCTINTVETVFEGSTISSVITPITTGTLVIKPGKNVLLIKGVDSMNITTYYDSYCVGVKEYIIYGE
jgi:hypothetical protein